MMPANANTVVQQHAVSGTGVVAGGELNGLKKLQRTSEFWLRATSIYAGYKATQIRYLMMKAAGWSKERLQRDIWDPQHERAAEQMYSVCVDLRGFYLKVGCASWNRTLCCVYIDFLFIVSHIMVDIVVMGCVFI